MRHISETLNGTCMQNRINCILTHESEHSIDLKTLQNYLKNSSQKYISIFTSFIALKFLVLRIFKKC